MVNKKRGQQTEKSVEFSLRTIKICRFEIIDGVEYVYCIKHAYKFVLREQVGFAAVLWRLRQGVSCLFIVIKAHGHMCTDYFLKAVIRTSLYYGEKKWEHILCKYWMFIMKQISTLFVVVYK